MPDADETLIDAKDRRRSTSLLGSPKIDKAVGSILLAALTTVTTYVGTVVHEFESGQKAMSAEILGLKGDLGQKINDLGSKLAVLEARSTEIGEIKATLLRLDARILDVERRK